jgi:hypothetical protein
MASGFEKWLVVSGWWLANDESPAHGRPLEPQQAIGETGETPEAEGCDRSATSIQR